MRSYLLITTVDVARMANNREHHLLRHIAPHFDQVYVVFRRKCEKAGWRQLLRDALVPGARTEWRDGICYVEVNPLFNHAHGLAMAVAGTYEMHDAGDTRGRGWRQRVYRLFSGIGLWKDWSTVAFLGLYALRTVPGTVDVCTAMGPNGNAAAWLLRRLGKLRVWAYEDRDYEPGFFNTPLRHRAAAALEVACLRRADLCISIGHRLQRLRQQQSGREVAVVTTGVDVDRYTAPQRVPTRPVLVYTGNVTFWSGLERVIEALPRIREALPGATLLVVGDGLPGYVQGLQALTRQLGVHDAVRFTGRVPNTQIRDLLADAHLGVATFQPLELRKYAFPLKVLEYMAAGLPSIGTEGTETEDILRQHDCGVAVPYTAAAFAEAAIAMLGDPARYQRLAAHARESARQYDWHTLMAREHALLQQAWLRRQPAAPAPDRPA
ncbi:glycosyltransferase [Ideonella sp. DXS22W]|uniref:Glycosyltransferase n=1 Tax=Pseudaquabacterium inlustre TaxID=2984192 RepID=A0ABU9CHH5_9BURK